jgi:hypothetical protein
VKAQFSFRQKLTILLLMFVAIIDTFTLALFKQVDSIVNVDLYKFGLQYSLNWAKNYSSIVTSFELVILISISLIPLVVGSFVIKREKNKTFISIFGSAVLFIQIVLNIFSSYIFTRLDYLINHDLYNFGLRFNNTWASVYRADSWQLSVSIDVGCVILLIAALLILSNFRSSIRNLPKKAVKEPQPKSKIDTVESPILVIPQDSPVSPRKLSNKVPEFDTTLNLVKFVWWFLLVIGSVTLLGSLIFSSSAFAFVGLGLIFWGIVFAYARTDEYVKKSLFDATAFHQSTTMNQMVGELGYKGQAIYLPQKFFKLHDSNKVFISKGETSMLPLPETVREAEEILILQNPSGMLLTPPGSGLVKLFEEKFETSLVLADLRYLEENLPKLFSGELEIAKNVQIKIESDLISVKIESLKNAPEIELQLPAPLGSPLSNGLACILAKTLGKPIVFEQVQPNNDLGSITLVYRILSEEEIALQ